MSTALRELTEVEKVEHGNFLTTTVAALANWARKSSLWPYPFGTACCGIEFMAVASDHYDIARFGSEVVRFSPRQSDVPMVLGTINDKMGPVLKKIYDLLESCCGSRPTVSYVRIGGVSKDLPADFVPRTREVLKSIRKYSDKLEK
jgi:NADH-quinone oxidoreductase subunit B